MKYKLIKQACVPVRGWAFSPTHSWRVWEVSEGKFLNGSFSSRVAAKKYAQRVFGELNG